MLATAALLAIAASAAPSGSPAPPDRIVFVGNSITTHAEARPLGWFGNHGMAASTPEKDYVHLVAAKLRAQRFDAVNLADWEADPASLDCARLARWAGADLAVFKLGENVPAEAPGFARAFARLADCLAPRRAVVVSTWWTGPRYARINADLEAVARAKGWAWVELPAHDRRHDAPGFADPGVAAHPGDAGMRLIADAIVAEVKRRGWYAR
jgi:alpha-galactosidase